jgi:acetolactate synthase-1/2/3 large subunit
LIDLPEDINLLRMTIPQYIASSLFNAGVRYVFGIPGGPSIPYMEAFRNEGIEFVLVSNEAAAGIMADVTGRLTGIPGVCHATFGPGATNISTGVGGAFLDRSPMIVLTSEMSDSMIGRTAQMNIDHQRLFAPLTKATFRLNRANVADVLVKTIRICREEYPGPVHIGIPDDIAGYEIGETANPISEIKEIFHRNDDQNIESLLAVSRKPLLAVGLTAKRMGIGPVLNSFLEKYRIPVVITPMAKGLMNEEHPSFAGVLFHALSDYLEDIIEKSDLIIGLGYDPVEYNYESWVPGVPLIHFDIIKSDLPARENVKDYVGKPEEWFRILGNLNAGSLVLQSSVIEGIRNEMFSVFNGFSGHFGPVAAMQVLQEELPADAIMTADVGSHLHLAGQFWKTYEKGEFIISNGWSGMGFGIPSALAAQINRPDSTVVCMTGDGGFLMMAGEMITARRYNLPIIVIVFSDGELNLIKLKQSWKEISPYGTLLYQGDLFGTDTFFGVKVLTADSADTMRKTINTALSLDEPVIISAIIDPEDYKWLIVKR